MLVTFEITFLLNVIDLKVTAIGHLFGLVNKIDCSLGRMLNNRLFPDRLKHIAR